MSDEGRLIVTADDFGIHPSVNEAIDQALADGGITDVSMLATADHLDQAIKLATDHDIDVGVHLSLVGQRPVEPVDYIPSLVDEHGRMPAHFPEFLQQYLAGRIDLKHIRDECFSQVERIAASGLDVTHLDAHEHLHMVPGIFNVVLDICEQWDINYVRTVNEIMIPGWWEQSIVPVFGVKTLSWWNRTKLEHYDVMTNDRFAGVLWPELHPRPRREYLLDAAQGGTTEWGVHVATETLSEVNGYDQSREFTDILDWLCSSEFNQELQQAGLELMSIGDWIQRRKADC